MSSPHATESVPCNLCGSSEARAIYEAVDAYGKEGDGTYRYVRCTHCGLVRLDPRIPEARIGAFYPPEVYLPKADPSAAPGAVGRLEAAYVRHLGLHQVRESLAWASRSGLTPRSVFDFGCGPGHRLALYRERGLTAAGLEISDDADWARARYGLEVFRGTLADYLANRDTRTFDLVTCYYVAEHLYDPQAALRQLASLQREGGMLVVAVPNADAIQARVFRARWSWNEAPRHTFLYTRATLSEMLARAGYRVVGITTRSNFWHPVGIVLSLFPGLDPRYNWRDAAHGKRLLPLARRVVWALATLALAPLAWLEGVSGHGTQLTAFAVKDVLGPGSGTR